MGQHAAMCSLFLDSHSPATCAETCLHPKITHTYSRNRTVLLGKTTEKVLFYHECLNKTLQYACNVTLVFLKITTG